MKEACKLNPKFHQAVLALGNVHLYLNKPDKALVEYERAIAMKPDYARAYAMRGFVRIKAGDFKAALADYETAKKYDPGDPEIDAGLTLVRKEIDGPKWKKSFTCETEHYLILTPVSQEFADEMGLHAELIYFLVRGGAPPDAEAGPYFKYLQDYFKALRAGQGQESAFQSTFGKTDVSKLEREWAKFILSLPVEKSEPPPQKFRARQSRAPGAPGAPRGAPARLASGGVQGP